MSRGGEGPAGDRAADRAGGRNEGRAADQAEDQGGRGAGNRSRDAVLVAMTGASGAAYGLRLIDALLRAERAVQVVLSGPGRTVVNTETPLRLGKSPAEIRRALLAHLGRDDAPLRVFGTDDWFAPPASGSNPPAAVVVCPCTTGTLGAVAAGTSRNLIERAADVALKEGRRLVLVVRETPLSAVHLENMLRLARAGAAILPANPGFYHRPESVSDLVDFVVARVLDRIGVEHDLAPRWASERE